MGAKTWYDAFKESINVVFTKEDFGKYLAEVESCIDFYRKHLGKDTKILDIGCGLGVGSIPLSTFGYKITGIDNDMRVVEAARMNAERFGKDVRIVHGDAFDIDKMFERVEYGWMDNSSIPFDGMPIIIRDEFITKGNKKTLDAGVFTTDIDLIQANPADFSKDGFALI